MIVQGNDPFLQPSFSLKNRCARLIWNLVWIITFRFSPRPFHSWRRLVLKCFGATVGNDVHVYPGVRIWAPWNLEVGDRVGIADGVILYSMDKIKIGRNSVVSQGAHLCGGSHDIKSKNFQLIAAPISIGADAWICAEAFIGPGVTVADGVVVGARGVAVRSIDQPWSVWAGNPCEFKKMRVLR